VAFIDVGSFGIWGEGHTYSSSRLPYSAATVRRHIDLYKKNFQRTLLVANDDFVSQGRIKEPPGAYLYSKGGRGREESVETALPDQVIAVRMVGQSRPQERHGVGAIPPVATIYCAFGKCQAPEPALQGRGADGTARQRGLLLPAMVSPPAKPPWSVRTKGACSGTGFATGGAWVAAVAPAAVPPSTRSERQAASVRARLCEPHFSGGPT